VIACLNHQIYRGRVRAKEVLTSVARQDFKKNSWLARPVRERSYSFARATNQAKIGGQNNVKKILLLSHSSHSCFSNLRSPVATGRNLHVANVTGKRGRPDRYASKGDRRNGSVTMDLDLTG